MIKWDKPCYKCLSHFCDLSCKEPKHLQTPQRTEQEPVGWLDSNDKLAEFMHKDLKAEHDKRDSSTPRAFQIPVYTTPPQRKPLSDEQVREIAKQYALGLAFPYGSQTTPEMFARAIEQAHGIKE